MRVTCRWPAMLLCGWVLMQPSVRQYPDGWGIVESDIEGWYQVRAADSADDCEEAKVVAQQVLKKHAAESTSSSEAGTKARFKAMQAAHALASQHARCVPADRIYPPKQPGPAK